MQGLVNIKIQVFYFLIKVTTWSNLQACELRDKFLILQTFMHQKVTGEPIY